METIRIGIVGAGANTVTHHIPKLQAIAGCQIMSVCNRSRASSQRVADQFGIPVVYDHWQDLVAAPDTDAIVIGTWPYMHCRVTLAALQAGKHVLCEARMAMNAREAHAMRDAARAKPQLVAQVVPSPMTLGVDHTIKRLLAEGYLGDLLVIGDTELTEISIPPDQSGGWRVEQEFVNAIRGQEPITHTSFEDGVKYMEFTEAVARSMPSGAAVALPQ
jgi:predicted dehydrogenase